MFAVMGIRYTKKEERLNAWSHAAGVVLGLVAGTALMRRSVVCCDGWAVAGVALYLFGMLSSYV